MGRATRGKRRKAHDGITLIELFDKKAASAQRPPVYFGDTIVGRRRFQTIKKARASSTYEWMADMQERMRSMDEQTDAWIETVNGQFRDMYEEANERFETMNRWMSGLIRDTDERIKGTDEGIASLDVRIASLDTRITRLERAFGLRLPHREA